MEYLLTYSILNDCKIDYNEQNINKLFQSVGGSADKTLLEKSVAAFSGKSYCELLEEGRKKMSTIASANASAAPAAKAEEAPKEKVEEEKKEEAIDLDFDIFG